MMKQTIKRVLQERQRKEYRKELASQLRDYDSWIRGQETPLLVSEYVAEKSEKTFSVSDYTGENFQKCLTNETKMWLDGGSKMENEGKNSESSLKCISYRVFCKKHPDSTKSPAMTLLSMNAGQFPLSSFRSWCLSLTVCSIMQARLPASLRTVSEAAKPD